MTHLSNSQVEAYWARKLAPVDLLALDRHVGECQNCRGALMAAAPRASLPSMAEWDAHVAYEHLEEYVNGGGSAEGRLAVEQHTSRCADCRAELGDLRRFRSEYRHRSQSAGWRSRHRWLRPAVGIAASISVALLLTQLPGGAWAPGPTKPSGEMFAMIVRDGGQSLGLDSQGRLRGLANLPDSENVALATILAGGPLPLPPSRLELTANGGVTRGTEQQAPEFTVTDPLGRVTLEDRPVFRWKALPGASSYRVQILDLEYRLVMESPALTGTEWQPEQPLGRSGAYSWQVTARRNGVEIRAPQPPASEARFAVLDQDHANRLTAALARTPVSHLALSALYAEAGMNRECLREVVLLEQDNPRSSVVARLKAQVSSRAGAE